MGKAIGKKLPFGFRGSVTRTPDTIIAPYAISFAELCEKILLGAK